MTINSFALPRKNQTLVLDVVRIQMESLTDQVVFMSQNYYLHYTQVWENFQRVHNRWDSSSNVKEATSFLYRIQECGEPDV